MSHTTASAPRAASGRASAYAVLRESGFRWYLGGQLVSLVGSLLQSAVILLFIASALRLTQEQAATASGVFWALTLVPGAFLGPFAGALLDAWNKRVALVVTAILGAVQALILARLTAVPDHVALWQLYALAVFGGLVNAFDSPGRNAIVKDIVRDPQSIRQAAKMFTSLYNIAQVAGPGFAGYLVLAFGYPTTFVLNALSFLVLIAALLRLRMRHEGPDAVARHERPPLSSTWRKISQGFAYAYSERGLRLCIVLTSFVSIFGFSYYVLLAVFNRYALHGGPVGYSHLTASQGIGALAASAAIIALGDRVPHRLVVIGGMLVSAASLIGLSRATTEAFAAACVFGAGAGFVATFTLLRSSIMHICDHAKIGIVVGIAFCLFYGGMMTGSFFIGPLADVFGMRAVIGGCGVSMLVIAAVTRFLPGIDEIG